MLDATVSPLFDVLEAQVSLLVAIVDTKAVTLKGATVTMQYALDQLNFVLHPSFRDLFLSLRSE
jgi:hypothetical protein